MPQDSKDFYFTEIWPKNFSRWLKVIEKLGLSEIRKKTESEMKKIPFGSPGINFIGEIPAEKTRGDKGFLIGISSEKLCLFEYIGESGKNLDMILALPLKDKDEFFSKLELLVTDEK